MVMPQVTVSTRAMVGRVSMLALGSIAGCGTLLDENFSEVAEGCWDAASETVRGRCAAQGGAGGAAKTDDSEPGSAGISLGSGHGGVGDVTGQPQGEDGGSAQEVAGGGAPVNGGSTQATGDGGGGAGAGNTGGTGDAGGRPESPPGTVRPKFQGTTWPDKTVPVCWRDKSERPDIATHVESVVREAWGRASGLRFEAWERCSPDPAGFLSVGLDTSNEGDIDGIGATDARRISLGIYMQEFDAAVVHLFGHALGFDHGPLGPQKDVMAGACERSEGSVEPTAFWERSVMRPLGHCDPSGLGAWDVMTLQTAYGRKGAGALVSLGSRCIDIPNSQAKPGRLQIYECNFERNQSWYRSHDGQLFAAYAPALAMDVAVGAEQAFLQLYPRSQPPAPNQQFVLADGQLRGIGDSCLGLASETGVVQVGPCALLDDADWKIGSAGTIEANGSCLTSSASDDEDGGGRLFMAPCDASVTQAFGFARTGQLRQDQRCLDVLLDEGDDLTAERPVHLAACRSELDPKRVTQQFYFRGRVLSEEQCLHITGRTSIENGGLEMVACSHLDPSQRWDYYFTDPI